jgi:hypothetical protein
LVHLKLRTMQPSIRSFAFQELVVRADLGNPAALDNHEPIRPTQRA